ncbi:hypothetical protein [Actinoplanes sp. HUAS TT8]|uniref:hypothetical protein n=1 Tax=Actinoplanes sp. HUAS TT8 TaxID=3447453 RepID=UPI003F52871D
MPAQPFSIHPNLDELARQSIAAALSQPARTDGDPDQSGTADTTHHGARDTRQAARLNSERARSGKAASSAGGRTYAFRRS